MRTSLIMLYLFSAVLLTASCGLLRSKEVIRTEVVRDSIVYRNETHIDTLLIKRDTFTNEFQIEALKQLGQLTFRGDRTTTKIIYRDGIYKVVTDSDSILKLIENKFSSIEKYKNKTVDKQVLVKARKPPSWIYFALILAVLITAYLIILKLKNNEKI